MMRFTDADTGFCQGGFILSGHAFHWASVLLGMNIAFVLTLVVLWVVIAAQSRRS